MAIEDRQRDGAASIVELARKICAITQTFGFVIEAKYPVGTPVRTLYIAATGLCALIPPAQDALYDPQGGNEIPTDEPSNIPGINPARPPRPDLPDEE